MTAQMDETLQLLRGRRGYADLGRSANPEEVKLIEEELDLTVPEEYRYLLLQCGYVQWFGHSIYGIAPDTGKSVIANTLAARRTELPPDFIGIPKKGLVVKDYGGGGYYILYSADSERRGQVSLVLDELFGREEMYWSDFTAFLECIVNGVRNWISVESELS